MVEQQTNNNCNNNDDGEGNVSDDEGIEIDGILIPPPLPPPTRLTVNAANSTRLIITEIHIQYFKSFAENKILGPFHKCFNAIIGPNGSGKSNVIDSLLFVFGYRASRIRTRAVTELLHHSDRFNNVQMCKVEVHFVQIIDKECDDYDVVADSQIVIARTALKNSTSFYTLNGRRTELRNISRLLMQHGVDLNHNRFLILQGEIEEIAMMKCKAENEHETGMLEYLEDVIGTNRYQSALIQLEERVEQLTTLRTEKLNRVRLVQAELDELRQPMQVAVEFLRTENKITACNNFIYQFRIAELIAKSTTINSDVEKVLGEQRDLQEKLNTIAEKKKEQTKVVQSETVKYEQLKKRNDKFKDAYNNADKRDVKLQAEMQQLVNNRKAALKQIAEDTQKLEDYRKIPDRNAKSINTAKEKELEMQMESKTYTNEKEKILTNIRQETQELQEERHQLLTKNLELNKIVTEKKSKMVLAENAVKNCIANRAQAETSLAMLRESAANTQTTLDQLETTIQQLDTERPINVQRLESGQRQHTKCTKEIARLEERINQLQTSVEEARQSKQAFRSQNIVVNALMAQKEAGQCAGLYGRLGDLGGIDPKYDVAISTACPVLDYFVVDNADTAEWCIEYLRNSGKGRGSFIALDKQRHFERAISTSMKTPENVHRLFDLVSVNDDRIRTAFYYALRDTLVADNLDQAIRIAYGQKRYRVVTLQGEIIEISGSMSGGGRTVIRGKMGRSARISRQSNGGGGASGVPGPSEAELNSVQLQLTQLQQERTELTTTIQQLEQVIRGQHSAATEHRQQIEQLRQKHVKQQEQIAEQVAHLATVQIDERQMARLQKASAEARQQYDMAAREAATQQERVDAISAEIQERTAGRLNSVEAKIREVSARINRCNADIKKLSVETKMSEKNEQQTVQRLEKLTMNVTQIEQKLKSMKEERDQIEVDGEKLLKCIEEGALHLNEASEQVRALNESVKRMTLEENGLKSTKVDVDECAKQMTNKKRALDGEIAQNRARLAHLKLHEIPFEEEQEQEMEAKSNENNQEATPTVALTTFEGEDVVCAATMEHNTLALKAAEQHLKTLKPNLETIDEYRSKRDTFVKRSDELQHVTEKRTQIRGAYDELRKRRKDEFTLGFNLIRLKLKEIYQMITLGGDADFEMIDSFDPFSDGIQFKVRPPQKSWKNISNLSGGEKTLSSLALVFALHYYKPSPLYVMDEIDAALDFKNVSIVGHYVKERTKNAQFIIISLRSEMFELCDYLFGIYKNVNFSHSICIDPRQFAQQKSKDDQSEGPAVSQQQHTEEAELHNVEGPAQLDAVENRLIEEDTTPINNNISEEFSLSSLSQADDEDDAVVPDSCDEPMNTD